MFTLGANLPWLHYGIDFGANAWMPNGGIALPAPRGSLDVAFERLAASGIRHVRWFLFCDGRAGIRFTGGGRPAGLDDFVFRDVDAALELTRRHGLLVMFVLLDFLWCDSPRAVHGVQLCGRTQVLQDPSHRHALLDTVFRPLFDRYATEPGIFAWDVINEPEWIKTLSHEELREFLIEATRLVHAVCRQPVTVGSAGARWRNLYKGLGLDFYQVHWYDALKHQPPLETPVDELAFDRPVLLGEYPTRGSKKSTNEIIDAARRAGYTGAFYWSMLADDECSARV